MHMRFKRRSYLVFPIGTLCFGGWDVLWLFYWFYVLPDAKKLPQRVSGLRCRGKQQPSLHLLDLDHKRADFNAKLHS